MAIGFGIAAQRYADQLDSGSALIAGGIDGCTAALAAAVEWRRAGRRFGVAPLIDEPRALIAAGLGGRWIQQLTGIDERYRAFDALATDRLAEAGVAISAEDLAVVDEPARRVLRDFAIMGDVLVVRSQREAERVGRILQRRRPTIVTIPGEERIGPVEGPIAPGDGACGQNIVVWAPDDDAASLGVIAMALEYLRSPVIYVCRSGRLANVRGTFVDPAAGATALTSAGCVIAASIGDPGAAMALTRIGVPIVAASTAGATEFLDGVLEFDPWDWRTVFAAVAAARGVRPPTLKASREPAAVQSLTAALATAGSTLRTGGPRVSVVVLTYNRRELLPLALASIAKQTYANIEILVVNNGGVDIRDIVGPYANARLLNLPENILPNAAVEIGFAAGSGKYFGVISDDDEFFPDHFARLVDALERSGGAVAHTNTVTRYLELRDGKRETVAYRVRADRPSDRLQILVGGTMSFHSMLFRRDVRAAIGTLRVELAPADLEYTVRAAQHYDFVYVDAVTCEWNCAIDGSSYTFRENMYEGLKIIYDDYPSGPSSIVEERRRRELERFSTRRAGQILWPPDLLISQPK